MRSELRHITKGDRKIDEYLLRIKALVDALASIGNPITMQEHIDSILEGFPEEYHILFPTIESRIDPHSVAEIEALLLSHESRLERLKAKTVVDSFSVNLAHTSSQQQNQVSISSSSPHNSSNNSQYQYQNPNSFGNGYRGGRGGHYGHRGGGRGGRYFGRGGVECQICPRNDHDATICYYRFDQHYVAPPPQANQFERGPTPSQYNNSSQVQSYGSNSQQHVQP